MRRIQLFTERHILGKADFIENVMGTEMSRNAMTALVGSIQKFSTEDGPGIRTTVFIKGCPLHCAWCHNPELISFEQQVIEMPGSCIQCGYCISICPNHAVSLDTENRIRIERHLCSTCLECVKGCYAQALRAVAEPMTVMEILDEVVKDKAFYDHTGGGMTVSGGEILSQPDFVSALIDEAADRQISVCLDTSGFGNGARLMELACKENVTDILYDMKAIDDSVHKEYTGQSNISVLENLERIASSETIREKIQMRMPLIGGINDTDEMIERTAVFYKKNKLKRLTLLPYHNLGVSKEKHIGGEQQVFRPPSDETVERIKIFFETEASMNVEIIGKI